MISRRKLQNISHFVNSWIFDVSIQRCEQIHKFFSQHGNEHEYYFSSCNALLESSFLNDSWATFWDKLNKVSQQQSQSFNIFRALIPPHLGISVYSLLLSRLTPSSTMFLHVLGFSRLSQNIKLLDHWRDDSSISLKNQQTAIVIWGPGPDGEDIIHSLQDRLTSNSNIHFYILGYTHRSQLPDPRVEQALAAFPRAVISILPSGNTQDAMSAADIYLTRAHQILVKKRQFRFVSTKNSIVKPINFRIFNNGTDPLSGVNCILEILNRYALTNIRIYIFGTDFYLSHPAAKKYTGQDIQALEGYKMKFATSPLSLLLIIRKLADIGLIQGGTQICQILEMEPARVYDYWKDYY